MMKRIIKNESNPQEKKRFLNKKILILCFIFIVIIGCVIGALFYFNNNKSSSPVIELSEADKQIVADIASQAEVLSSDGGTDQTIALYDKAISENSNSAVKDALSSNKALVYINDEKYDEALSILKQIETRQKDENTYLLIAMVYEYKGDYKNSAEYYKLAMSKIDNSSQMANSDRSYYENKIEVLNNRSQN